MAEIVKLTSQPKGQNVPIQSETFSLLKAAAELAQAAVQEPEDLNEVERQQKKVQRALRKLETVLGRRSSGIVAFTGGFKLFRGAFLQSYLVFVKGIW